MIPRMRDNTRMSDSRIQRLLEEIDARKAPLGLSDRALSIKAGLSSDFVRDLRRGQSRNPETKRLEAIASALGCTLDDLTGRGHSGVSEPSERANRSASPPSEVSAADVEVPHRYAMPRNVPVLGTAAGSHGNDGFQIEGGDVIDQAPRLPGIASNKAVYALYVVNDSMEPRYFAGDLIYVDPRRPVGIGDFVIVQQRAGQDEPVMAYIGRLKRRTPEKTVIEKYNPSDTTREFAARTVAALHYVMTLQDLAGV